MSLGESIATVWPKTNPIKDIDVNLDGWHLSGQNESIVQYDHANGDVFSINFFDKQPDIGASLGDVTEIRNFYRNMLIPNKMGLLECDVYDIDGRRRFTCSRN